MIRTASRIARRTKRRTERPAGGSRGVLEPLESRVLFTAGDLDSYFGSGGVALADFGSASVAGIDVATFGDRTYAAGVVTAANSTQQRIALAAFDRAGRPDPSLGGDGTVVTTIAPAPVLFPMGEMAVQPNGKIAVLTGCVSGGSSLARFNPDGSTDTSFGGGDGHVEVNFYCKDLALAPGGKLVICGVGPSGRFAVAQFNADGSPDRGFDGDGLRELDFGSDVAVMADGRIVLVGAEQLLNSDGEAFWYGAVARLNPDGAYDTTFGTGGRQTYFFGSMDNGISAATVGPNGEVLVGTMEGEEKARPMVITGSAVIPAATTFSPVFADLAAPNRIHVMADGKVVVAGTLDDTTLGDGGPATFLARYNPDGSFDPSFANGHVTRVETAQTALTPQGDIVALAKSVFDDAHTLGVVRYLGRDANSNTTVIQPEGAAHLKRGAVAAHSQGGYTGAGYVDFIGDSGAQLWTEFYAHDSGDYQLHFRYANGSHRVRTVQVQFGDETHLVNFLPTGSWTRWRETEATFRFTKFTPVSNLVPVVMTTIGRNGPNIDRITVVRPPEPPSSGVVQAENGKLVGAFVSSANAGYTGRGYVDYQDDAGDSVEWLVNAEQARTGRITIRYANGSAAARPLELRVNGSVLNTSLSFAPTGSWSTWQELTVQVPLRYGTNTIRLTSVGKNGPNLDSLTIA